MLLIPKGADARVKPGHDEQVAPAVLQSSMPPLLTFSIGPATCDILVADITTLAVDAIVNEHFLAAVETRLRGHGGRSIRPPR